MSAGREVQERRDKSANPELVTQINNYIPVTEYIVAIVLAKP